jgi:hypothetical protein
MIGLKTREKSVFQLNIRVNETKNFNTINKTDLNLLEINFEEKLIICDKLKFCFSFNDIIDDFQEQYDKLEKLLISNARTINVWENTEEITCPEETINRNVARYWEIKKYFSTKKYFYTIQQAKKMYCADNDDTILFLRFGNIDVVVDSCLYKFEIYLFDEFIELLILIDVFTDITNLLILKIE